MQKFLKLGSLILAIIMLVNMLPTGTRDKGTVLLSPNFPTLTTEKRIN